MSYGCHSVRTAIEGSGLSISKSIPDNIQKLMEKVGRSEDHPSGYIEVGCSCHELWIALHQCDDAFEQHEVCRIYLHGAEVDALIAAIEHAKEIQRLAWDRGAAP